MSDARTKRLGLTPPMTTADLTSARLGDLATGALCREGCPMCICAVDRAQWAVQVFCAVEHGQFRREIEAWFDETGRVTQ